MAEDKHYLLLNDIDLDPPMDLPGYDASIPAVPTETPKCE